LAADELRVMTTLYPLYEMCTAVGGSHAKTEMLLPPGADPHSWEPKPGDLRRLAQADLFVMIGADLEPWIADLVAAAGHPQMELVEAALVVPPLLRDGESEKHEEGSVVEHGAAQDGHVHSGADLHLWLDLVWCQHFVDRLTALYARHDPAHRQNYADNGAAYKKRLQKLHEEFQAGLASCRTRTFFVGGHGAYGFLAARYGLEQVSLFGISPDAESTPRDLAQMVDRIRASGATHIFFELQVSDRLAKAVAAETGARTLLIRSGDSLTSRELKEGITFLSLMEQNLRSLQTGLACQ